MQDLESGIHYSLVQEIGMRKVIAGDDLDALKAYVHALAKVGTRYAVEDSKLTI